MKTFHMHTTTEQVNSTVSYLQNIEDSTTDELRDREQVYVSACVPSGKIWYRGVMQSMSHVAVARKLQPIFVLYVMFLSFSVGPDRT